MVSETSVMNFITYVKDTNNFMSLVDPSLNTSVDLKITNRILHLESAINEINNSANYVAHQLHLQHINTELNILLDSISEEFSQTEGGGLRLSPQQAEVMQRATELTIILQGYIAIMNDTESVININYERLKKMQLLKDLDISTLEQVYRNMDRDSEEKQGPIKLSKTNTTFNEIIGIDSIRDGILNNLQKSKILAQDPDYDSYVFLLLTGPPGTGKTSISHSVASEHSNGLYYNLDTEFFNSPRVGETEKNINAVFNTAKASNGPVTIIIDEIDNILGTSDNPNFRSHMQTVKITLQTQIDDVGNLKRNIVIVGMTNYFNRIDPIMHRRITYTSYIPPPDNENLLKYYTYLVTKKTGDMYFNLTNDYITDIQRSLLSKKCNNERIYYTNANIKQIYRNALVDTLSTATEYTLIINNSNVVAMVFGDKRNFKVADKLESNTMSGQSDITSTYQSNARDRVCFIVPSIDALAKASELTNVMTEKELQAFKEINTPVIKSCTVAQTQLTVAKGSRS